MNFRVIEGSYADVDSIYDDFEYDYLYSNHKANSLRGKYGLTHKEFKELCDTVKKNHGLSRRPRVDTKDAKYYYRSGHGWVIQKKVRGNTFYLGRVHSEELACRIVKLCKKARWNIDVCKQIYQSECDAII